MIAATTTLVCSLRHVLFGTSRRAGTAHDSVMGSRALLDLKGDHVTHASVQDSRNEGFLTGLIAGGIIGSGLAMYFASRAAAEPRTRAAGSARSLGDATDERFQRARTRVADAIDGLTRTGQDVRDERWGTVAQGAQEVERYAMQTGSVRIAGRKDERQTGR
jgi:gas vesicle protein